MINSINSGMSMPAMPKPSSPLTSEQKEKVQEILSQFSTDELSGDDALSIVDSFKGQNPYFQVSSKKMKKTIAKCIEDLPERQRLVLSLYYYEDLNLKSLWNKFTGKHRIRLEQRFIHKDLATNQFQNWVRYNLNISYPISEKWNVYVFNELFLNLNRSKRFAQNWTGTGFLYKLNENLKFKMGYFQIKSPTRVLKRLQLGVILNTNFTKNII